MEYLMFRCDNCGIEARGLPRDEPPPGWIAVYHQGGNRQQHFCSYACLVIHAHDGVDYRTMPKGERVRTALQSLGILRRRSALALQQVEEPEGDEEEEDEEEESERAETSQTAN